jgi:hypothetical protein
MSTYQPWIVMIPRGPTFTILGTEFEAECAASDYLNALPREMTRKMGMPRVHEPEPPEREWTHEAIITASFEGGNRSVDVYDSGIGNLPTTRILPASLARGQIGQAGRLVTRLFPEGRILRFFRPQLI